MKVELVAFVAAFFVQGTTSKASETSKWVYCDKYTTDNADKAVAECGKFSAPLCYPGVCTAPTHVDQTIELFVKRFPANNYKTATNVWILGDNLGYASDYMEISMASLNYKLNNSINIYTMDPRGTGRSTRLTCASDPSVGNVTDPALVASCAQELETKYGDLVAFSSTSAAHDIVNLIAKLSNGASTILYGMQYGALLVERVMHLNPPGVTGYVLDGPLSTAKAFHYLTEQDSNIGEVASAFLERCDHDRVCSSHFKQPNTLTAVYQEILADMDNKVDSACLEMMDTADILQQNNTGSRNLRTALSYLLSLPSFYMTIPQFFYRLKRCQANDIVVLETFITKLMKIGIQKADPLYSNVQQNIVSFSELWERPTPSLAEMTKRFTSSAAGWSIHDDQPLYCAYSKEQSKACAKYDFGRYEAQGIIYEHDRYWNKCPSIPRQASVLVLSSVMEITVPHKYTKILVESLKGDNKELITFDYGARGTLTSTFSQLRVPDWDTCALKILASYVSCDGDLSGLDKSCLSEMEPLEMIPSDFTAAGFTQPFKDM